MNVIIVVVERNGKIEVCLTCKTSEKVIPPSVVRHSDLLKAIKFERKRVTCEFPWGAACNWAAWDPWEDPGWKASELCGALQVLLFTARLCSSVRACTHGSESDPLSSVARNILRIGKMPCMREREHCVRVSASYRHEI